MLVLAACAPVTASAAPGFQRDRTPLPAGVTGAGATTHAAVQSGSSGSGGAVLRMLLGLAVVIAIIYVLYRVLKRSADKNDKSIRAHGEMTVVATTPLAQSRALHLVRIGEELVLVGSSEQGVTPIRVYDADEVRRLGFDPRDDLPPLTPTGTGGMGFGNALVETLRKKTAR